MYVLSTLKRRSSTVDCDAQSAAAEWHNGATHLGEELGAQLVLLADELLEVGVLRVLAHGLAVLVLLDDGDVRLQRV
jgi:hypothetical protein